MGKKYLIVKIKQNTKCFADTKWRISGPARECHALHAALYQTRSKHNKQKKTILRFFLSFFFSRLQQYVGLSGINVVYYPSIKGYNVKQ